MADLRGAYLGTGKISIEDLDDPKGLIFLGNCSALSYEAQTQEIEDQDYTTPGGGLDASVLRITGVNINYTAKHFKAANIARALYGSAVDVAAGTVTGEPHKAFPGGMIKLAYPGATDVVVTPAGGGAAWILDTDYTLSPSGYPIFKEDGAGAAGDVDVEVDYSYAKHATIQALTQSGKRFRLVFEGLNEVRSGKPMVIEAYRVNHSPASLSLIGDEFQGMEFTAKIEKDQTKTATGVSQYLMIQDVE
tara:strand:- start:12978 stop:13721 length:744 start_codon:yes stop_codon:yes gene_type:complete